MSENEIIRTYDVSNTTARKALQELEQNGWVERIQGKGTVVSGDHVGRSVDRIVSFTTNMRRAGRKPSTQLLSLEHRNESHELTIGDRRCCMEGPLYVVNRLRFADGIPVMTQTHYISARLCPELESLNLESSLYDIYTENYGLNIYRVDQLVRATVIQEPGLMKLLELKRPRPGFFVDGVTFYNQNVLLEMEESLYRGDQYDFTVSAVAS